MYEFKMPSLGADMVEGRIVRWMVKPGDQVKKGDAIVEVDTQKAAVEVQIWEAGVVEKFLAKEGDVIPINTPILQLRETKESSGDAARLKISPAARRRADELHVSIEALKGTGPDGAIQVTDVERVAMSVPASVSKDKAAPYTASAEDRSREMRKAIAAAMAKSKREIPHYYLSTTVVLRKPLEFLSKINADCPIPERILMPAVLFRAIALALKKFPEFNGYWKETQFVRAEAVNLGVAISLRTGGLVAPAILNADLLTLGQMMKSVLDLVTRARDGGLRSAEYTEATATVTNLGERGSEAVFGVIYPPQVALIGAGSIVEKPWVVNGQVVVAPQMTLTLSADHRASDGHRGSLFLEAIKAVIENPENMKESV